MHYKKWSKAAMADACGVLPQNINRYLSGKSDPSRPIINLIGKGLNPDWARNGEGEMLSGKQPLNGRTEEIKRRFKVEDDEGYYRSGPAYLVPAIGPLQTPEKIKEGDVLGIEPDATPEEGDFVLVKTDAGPQIKRWTPGEPIIGVVTLLTRRRETLRQ